MIDLLQDLKSAILELKKVRPSDVDQNEFLHCALDSILESYGYGYCAKCGDIAKSGFIAEDICSDCHDKALRLADNDEWEYRHRHD